MTSRIAQVCKNRRETEENKARPPVAPLRGAAVFLHVWAIIIILVIGMILWATRMIGPIILYHSRLRHKPGGARLAAAP